MSRLDKAIRNKRYLVKKGKEIKLVIETNFGNQFELLVLDLSSTGLRGKIDQSLYSEEQFQMGSIIPSSKLLSEKGENFLGLKN